MKYISFLTLFAMLMVLYPWQIVSANRNWPKPISEDPGLNKRRELLMSHGITPTPGEMIRFLNNGFDLSTLPTGLPEEPQIKLVVVNAVIEELGITAAEQAVPILTRIVKRDMPDGIKKILQRDFEPIPMNVRGDQMETTERVLSLNAVVSLGLIGDPQVEETIINIMNIETGTAFITKGAIALGQMGSNKGIGPLVILASDIQSADSLAAFNHIYYLTGQNFGVTKNTSIARHRQLIDKLKAWYESEGQNYNVYRSEIIRRMKSPPMPEPLDPKSLRGLLRMSRDMSDYDKRWLANDELKKICNQRFDELKTISQDKFEDLDIRRAAMLQLVHADPKKSKSILRSLEKSEDQIIAQLATSLQSDINSFYKRQNN